MLTAVVVVVADVVADVVVVVDWFDALFYNIP